MAEPLARRGARIQALTPEFLRDVIAGRALYPFLDVINPDLVALVLLAMHGEPAEGREQPRRASAAAFDLDQALGAAFRSRAAIRRHAVDAGFTEHQWAQLLYGNYTASEEMDAVNE
jgi:hypothetical protein